MSRAWQDTTLSSPLYALMREMADDLHPEYNELPEEHPDVQALKAECMAALKAGRRATGAAKAAETRARNEEARASSEHGSLYPRLTKGTARQTKWATEIRFMKIRLAMGWGGVVDKDMAELVRQRTDAKFWIDTRTMSWERLVALYLKRD
jgi:hypothetical protein